MSIERFQKHNEGPGAIVFALRECVKDPTKVAVFCIEDHPKCGGEKHKTVAVGFQPASPCVEDGGKPSWRYAGENYDLDGAGSHALVPSWDPDQSIEHAAANLAYYLAIEKGRCGPNTCIFRMPFVTTGGAA